MSGLRVGPIGSITYAPVEGGDSDASVQDTLREVLSTSALGVPGDGSNATSEMQAAIDAAVGKVLRIQKPAPKYSLDPITIPSNSHIIIDPGTIFEARLGYDQAAATAERLITLNGVSNVVIEAYGATFQYNSGYTFTSEFNHIFRILDCQNVWIFGANANDSGGDGFYIGPSDQNDEVNTSSDGVFLVDCAADNNRRNGFSVISGRNIHLIRPRATNQPATILGYGIDVEPNKAATLLQVKIVDPYTSGNAGAGVGTILQHPTGSTTNLIDIEISGHVSEGDRWHFFHMASTGATSPRGSVRYLKPTGKGATGAGIRVLNNPVDGLLVDIDAPTVLDCNQATGGTVQSGSGIAVIADDAMTSTQKLGNVTITRPDIRSSDGDMQAPIYIQDTRTSPQGVDKTMVLDPVNLSGGTVAYCGFGGFGTWRDDLGVLSHDLTADLTLTTLVRYHGLIHNASAPGERQVFLPNRADYPDMVFEVRAAQYLRIVPDAASAIYPLSTVVGKYVRSNTIGSRLVISRRDATTWYVKEQIGTWAVEP